MKMRTRRAVRGLLEALCAFLLLVLGALVLGWSISACTFIVVRGNENEMSDIGGHGGGLTIPAPSQPSFQHHGFTR
ncbi:hypothetical protein [Caballeronia sp. INSB1]|jgi:hypothetical protein|uniref:hypothetical protein n=1 Tax=Caballeronia sp. INSB1 TaxID=2921751 RepID=UPI002032B437|nr:hypothetical protein [Caballeronia sp. INSB1]